MKELVTKIILELLANALYICLVLNTLYMNGKIFIIDKIREFNLRNVSIWQPFSFSYLIFSIYKPFSCKG